MGKPAALAEVSLAPYVGYPAATSDKTSVPERPAGSPRHLPVPPRRGRPRPWGGRAAVLPPVPVFRGSTAQVQGLYPWLYGSSLPPAGAYISLCAQATASATGLVLESCSGATDQQWAAGPDGWVWNVGAQDCLSDIGAATANGTQIVVTGCAANAQQSWRPPPPRINSGVITSGVSGVCADDSGGTDVEISACDSGTDQQWAIGGDANIRTLASSPLCWTLDNGDTSAGTGITLASCGSTDQEFAQGPADAPWITSVDTAAGNFTYSYDSDGDLATTSLGGTELSATVWDLNNPLPEVAEDTTSSGTVTSDYAWNPDGTLNSQTEGGATGTGTTYDAVTDWEGSVTGLVNTSGTQVSDTNYTAYGTPSTTGTVTSSIGYAGSYALAGSGLDDMRARDYDPAASEFLSVDPEQALTGQPYAYVSDSPVAGTDPSGRVEWGLCGSGLAQGGASAVGSACLVVTFDPFTGEFQFGGTLTGGGGLGMFGAGLGVGIQKSNANQISDLGGWFGMAGGSVSVGPDINWDGFTGTGTCNKQISGGDAGIGISADLDPNIFPWWEVHGGATYTGQSTFFSTNVYNMINEAASGVYKAVMWAFG
jgi:RHS repeat-associated protein